MRPGPVEGHRPQLPAGVLGMAERDPAWAAWVERLPGLVHDLLEEWELRRDGLMMHGFTALVVPVRTARGEQAVLKLAHHDEESELEHLALQHWHGQGAARLLRADPRRSALLIERLRSETLATVGDLEACAVVARLYGRLHVPAPNNLRPLTEFLDRWIDDLAQLPRNAPVPRRLVEQAVSLGRGLVSDPASTGVLIHTDLHGDNVLAADREPWLAIDPKPVSGDPHYEPAPMLWNRWDELVGDLRAGVRRRFHTLVDVAGLDEDRARDWVVVRMVLGARWRLLEDARRIGPVPSDDWLTRCVAIAKAVQV